MITAENKLISGSGDITPAMIEPEQTGDARTPTRDTDRQRDRDGSTRTRPTYPDPVEPPIIERQLQITENDTGENGQQNGSDNGGTSGGSTGGGSARPAVEAPENNAEKATAAGVNSEALLKYGGVAFALILIMMIFNNFQN